MTGSAEPWLAPGAASRPSPRQAGGRLGWVLRLQCVRSERDCRSRQASFILANGFSGHGLQQAPAVGRAIAEWITAGHYLSLDLSPLGYERIPNSQPLREDNII